MRIMLRIDANRWGGHGKGKCMTDQVKKNKDIIKRG